VASGKQAIKRRIKSVEATKKITQAMELISTSKLKRQKDRMQKNREYADTMKNMVEQIISTTHVEDVVWLKTRVDDNPLTLVFTSDLGLCAGYNTNLLRYYRDQSKTEFPVMVFGIKGYYWLKNRQYAIIGDFSYSDDLTFQDVSTVVNEALAMYINEEISSIRLLYTQFINSVSFQPILTTILPIKTDDSKKSGAFIDTIFEPSGPVILNQLIPMYARSLAYSAWLETKTSEQASRRMAMENATDNAEDIIEELQLRYNQSRQAAITQEISEIVAGADAL